MVVTEGGSATDFSKRLLRELRTRSLLSTRFLSSWMLDTLDAANLARLGFVLELIGEYLPDMSRHLPISRACVRAACAKIEEVCHRCGISLMIDR